jgi:hypothetical protein
MKGCLKIIVSVLLLSSIVLFALGYIYQSRVTNQAIELESEVEKMQMEFLYHIEERRSMINKSISDSLLCEVDSLEYYLMTSRPLPEIGDIGLLWEDEYLINEKLVVSAPCLIDSNNFDVSILDSLKRSSTVLNRILSAYNSRVFQLNTLRVRFPNNLFLMNKGIKRAEYFKLKYGVSNVDLMERKRKMEHWVETGEFIENFRR